MQQICTKIISSSKRMRRMALDAWEIYRITGVNKGLITDQCTRFTTYTLFVYFSHVSNCNRTYLMYVSQYVMLSL